MIEVSNIQIFGMEAALRGMRNPYNSWENSDSKWGFDEEIDTQVYIIGENDLDLAKRLSLGGATHGKFRRMITVYMDILAPLYWWKEFDTYKVGTVANSCSTMHKIAAKEFTLDDFSHEHLDGEFVSVKTDDSYFANWDILRLTIRALNFNREKFLETKDKKYWWQLIQLLPSSYNQLRTVELNYEVLSRMYFDRRTHRLDEWLSFCNTIETLPWANEIILPSRAHHPYDLTDLATQ